MVPFLLGPATHRALGQGNTSRRIVAANLSQFAPPSTGAVTGTYSISAKPAPNIPAIGGGETCVFITGTGTIVPGTTDTGNHTNDGTTPLALPFPVQLYGQTFNPANLCSNGNLQFVSNSNSPSNTCLPTTVFNFAIMPHWDGGLNWGSVCKS
ncbi:MAG: hypothetical protein WA183_05315 [Chthoniobacterales bacterium]